MSIESEGSPDIDMTQPSTIKPTSESRAAFQDQDLNPASRDRELLGQIDQNPLSQEAATVFESHYLVHCSRGSGLPIVEMGMLPKEAAANWFSVDKPVVDGQDTFVAPASILLGEAKAKEHSVNIKHGDSSTPAEEFARSEKRQGLETSAVAIEGKIYAPMIQVIDRPKLAETVMRYRQAGLEHRLSLVVVAQDTKFDECKRLTGTDTGRQEIDRRYQDFRSALSGQSLDSDTLGFSEDEINDQLIETLAYHQGDKSSDEHMQREATYLTRLTEEDSQKVISRAVERGKAAIQDPESRGWNGPDAIFMLLRVSSPSARKNLISFTEAQAQLSPDRVGQGLKRCLQAFREKYPEK